MSKLRNVIAIQFRYFEIMARLGYVIDGEMIGMCVYTYECVYDTKNVRAVWICGMSHSYSLRLSPNVACIATLWA